MPRIGLRSHADSQRSPKSPTDSHPVALRSHVGSQRFMGRRPLGARLLVTDTCPQKTPLECHPCATTMVSLDQHASFCKCSDPNCPAVSMMRKIRDMPTNGDVWSIETVAGFNMATTTGSSTPKRRDRAGTCYVCTRETLC